jgi:peroxiredoxin
VPAKSVPAKPVPKPVPTNHVPAKSVPAKPVPTNHVPAKSVPAKPVPTNHVPAKSVPTNHVPAKSVPTNHVPTNHVPTFKNTESQLVTKDVKRLITSVEIDTTINKAYLESLPKSDKLLYVANRGWRLNTEVRGNQLYDYAVKYINRKKHRIYLGKTDI